MVKKDEVGNTIGFITFDEHAHEVKTFLTMAFEEEADIYSKEYINAQKQIKELKKYIFIKIACAPIELSLAYIIFGRFEFKARLKVLKTLWKAFKRKDFETRELTKYYELC